MSLSPAISLVYTLDELAWPTRRWTGPTPTVARAADRCQALPGKNLLLIALPPARVPTRTCGLALRWVGQKRQWSGQQRMPRRRRPVLPPQTRRGKQHEAMRCLKRRITAWDGIHSLAGYVPTRQVSPTGTVAIRTYSSADERIVVKSAIDDSGCTSTGADTKGLRAKREASAALARTRQPAPVNQCQPWNAAEHGRLRRHADPLGGQVLHIVVGVMRRSGWRLSRSGW